GAGGVEQVRGLRVRDAGAAADRAAGLQRVEKLLLLHRACGRIDRAVRIALSARRKRDGERAPHDPCTDDETNSRETSRHAEPPRPKSFETRSFETKCPRTQRA